MDDKIEVLRRMSRTLEEMARAVFKSWFVDFDPVVVNALRAGNPIPEKFAQRAAHYRRNPGALRLPENTLRLFPDSFQNSELGPIPEGWEATLLGKVAEFVKGRSYKSTELRDSTTALVTLKSFCRGGGYRTEGLKAYTGSYRPEQIVRPGEIVVACTDVTQAAEVIGRPAIVQPDSKYETLVASLDTLVVRPTSHRITKSFLYYLMGTDSFVNHTLAHTTGTTVLHLAKTALPSFAFACPSGALISVFASIADAALKKIRLIGEECAILTALRDTLLPKLISGQLRVREAEQFLKERGL